MSGGGVEGGGRWENDGSRAGRGFEVEGREGGDEHGR